MPAFHLPTMDHAQPHIEGEAEQLAAFLAPPNDPHMTARLGQETIVRHEGALLVLQGERYKNNEGWVQGMRYLHLGETGGAVAALNITHIKRGRKQITLASNIYVAPHYRREGLARGLLERALGDYPGLCADTSMTTAGACLVGHAQPSHGSAKTLKP